MDEGFHKVHGDAGMIDKREIGIIPGASRLPQNDPNPFDGATRIAFTLTEGQRVSLEVYDILGEHVRTLVDEYRSAGTHQIELDSESLVSGIYFYRLTAGRHTETGKMVLMK